MADRSRGLADHDRMFGRYDAPKPDLLFSSAWPEQVPRLRARRAAFEGPRGVS
jgi:hypothetical protein